MIASGFIASRLPSTFFPEIDESMERIYVRFAPGTSLEESARMTEEIGKQLGKELGKKNVELVLANVGSPNNARSAMTSPNWGPYMGFIRLALTDRDRRPLAQRELADRSRAILARDFPGVEFLQAPGGLVASVFNNGYLVPLVAEVRGDKLESIDEQARAVAEVMRTVAGVRDVRSSLDMNYPEVRVDVDRETAGMVGVSARAIGQSTLEATLGKQHVHTISARARAWNHVNPSTSYDPHVLQSTA